MTAIQDCKPHRPKNISTSSQAALLHSTANAENIPINSQESAFPIVGIGASAGGLAAFEAFFSGLPSAVETGMAFVLVQHLAPDHKSLLAELVQRYTTMPVFEAEDGMVVRPNCVYIITPNHDMAFMNGTLQLLEPTAPRGHRMPIDFFFHSLATDLRERAIGIVLSGTGSDGAHGVRAIKAEGGMVMAQNPESTEFDGMPNSAIASGLVDYILPPAEMPDRLIAYAAHAFARPRSTSTALPPGSEALLQKIFVLLRAQTSHDFSQHKPSTIHRRVERRMAVHQAESMADYLSFLQETPAEVEALFRDLLIGVTNFFRDPEAFQALEDAVIPQIFAGKPAVGGTIRVWTAGCSTGEEAYSIAILLQERMEALRQSHTVQIFATDIDSRAILTARAGIYPASIAADLTPERLARYFVAEPGGNAYRVHKGLRDMLIFSEQDVIKDPPFSKLDLISCRNMMIYFGAPLQKKLLPIFHYSLNPRGMLFLGSSEGIGDFTDLFTVLDRKAKLYQRKEDIHGIQRQLMSRYQPAQRAVDAGVPRPPRKTAFPLKMPLRELTEQALLQQFSLAGLLVNERGDIYYQHGRSGMYLEQAPGEVSVSNIIKMARDGLREPLSLALHRAVSSQQVVCNPGFSVKTNGHYTSVKLTVRPVTPGPDVAVDMPLYLVVLEEAPAHESLMLPAADGLPAELLSDAEQRIAALQDALRAKDEYLQSTHEELESANEELKSSNEEMQSVNEELQSTNEEMETSKEELQSVNEELATVNAELNNKVADLSRLNNDMNNLLAGSGVATLFVDHQLRILRFTPSTSEVINLILSDIGRPVAHIVSNLVGYDTLLSDVKSVLDTLRPIDAEVQTTAGKWYMMAICPYRTLQNVIEGAVLTFVEITDRKRIEQALADANKLTRLAIVVRDAHDAITVQDMTGRITAWNPGAVRLYGWTEDEALGMNVAQRIPATLNEKAMDVLQQLSQAEALAPYRTERLTRDGSMVEVWVTATALLDEQGLQYAVATTEREVGRDPAGYR
jgi:two-component system, chemotaxis family, CheB/CheR fusion protein